MLDFILALTIAERRSAEDQMTLEQRRSSNKKGDFRLKAKVKPK
jgi:hypothetical protein